MGINPKFLKVFIGILITFLSAGGALFFAYYGKMNAQQSVPYKSRTPSQILDRAVNSFGIKETKSIKKENNELIFEENPKKIDHNKNANP